MTYDRIRITMKNGTQFILEEDEYQTFSMFCSAYCRSDNGWFMSIHNRFNLKLSEFSSVERLPNESLSESS